MSHTKATDTPTDSALPSDGAHERAYAQPPAAVDACRLLMVCRAFHDTYGDQALLETFCAKLGTVVPDTASETCAKNWRSLFHAQTAPADGTGCSQTECATETYYGGCCVYHGQLADGLPDGHGAMIFVGDAVDAATAPRGPRVSDTFAWTPSRGSRFEGRWSGGLFVEGRCAFTQSNGRAFVGVFKHPRVTGDCGHYDGTCVLPNVGRYTGQMRDGVKHGWGMCETVDGSRYEGQFAQDKRDGRGSVSYASGAKYEGQWKRDAYHGRGVYISNEGVQYEAFWDAGHPSLVC